MLMIALMLAVQAVPVPAPADLEALLAEARAHFPGLAAARGRLAAAETVPSQLEALPDPLAGISWTNAGLTSSTIGDDGDSMISLTWSQEVPYPGKRRLAGDAGRGEIDVVRWSAEQARLELEARVKRWYAELYHSDRSTAVLAENRVLLESFLATARSRYETGGGLLQNVLKAQTEISRLDASVETFAAERRNAQAQLNALAGRAIDAPLGPAMELPESAEPINADVLATQAMQRAPAVMRLEAIARRNGARVELARRQTKPDFVWGGAYGYRGDLDAEITGSFGMRLPLYRERKQAQAIAQTLDEAEAAQRDLETAKLEVAVQIRTLLSEALRAERLVRLYREAMIPQARSALDSSASAHATGRADFLMLLNDFTAVLSYELDSVTQRHQRFVALSALEGLTGIELLRAASATPGTPGMPEKEDAR